MSFTSGVYNITLGGSALLAGQVLTATVTVPGARPQHHVKITPQGDPGIGIYWHGWVSANDTVTARILAILALTPASIVYNVSVEA